MPLLGIPIDLPPILIQVGSEDVLLDDSRRYAVEARKAGTPVTLEVWQGMHHVFQLDVKTLVSSRPRGTFLEKWMVTVSGCTARPTRKGDRIPRAIASA